MSSADVSRKRLASDELEELPPAQGRKFESTRNTVDFHGSNAGIQTGQLFGNLNVASTEGPRQRAEKFIRQLPSDYCSQKDRNPPRITGTCEWFLTDERFLAWLDAPDARLLHVFARPGCGKSVLARTIIDERHVCNDNTTGLLYYFFKAGQGEENKACSALAAMVHQLYIQHTEITVQELMKPKYDAHGEKLAGLYETLWELLVDICKSIAGTIVCVLDALDECDTNDREKLLSTISTFYSAEEPPASNLKVVITSRPYPDIYFDIEARITLIRFDVDEKSDDIAQEIRKVIEIKVAKTIPKASSTIQTMIIDHLQSYKNRTYLWLDLILHHIKRNRIGNMSAPKLEKLCRDLPESIDEAYETLLNRSPDLKSSKKLLAITLAAQRPLTIVEMKFAFELANEEVSYESLAQLEQAIEPDEAFKESLTTFCGMLLVVDNDRIYFLHETVREYLLQPSTSQQSDMSRWKQSIELGSAHGMLAKACIHFLGFEQFQPPFRLAASLFELPIQNDRERGFRIKDSLRTEMLLFYALDYCHLHFRHSSTSSEHSLLPHPGIVRGLERVLNTWNYGWKRPKNKTERFLESINLYVLCHTLRDIPVWDKNIPRLYGGFDVESEQVWKKLDRSSLIGAKSYARLYRAGWWPDYSYYELDGGVNITRAIFLAAELGHHNIANTFVTTFLAVKSQQFDKHAVGIHEALQTALTAGHERLAQIILDQVNQQEDRELQSHFSSALEIIVRHGSVRTLKRVLDGVAANACSPRVVRNVFEALHAAIYQADENSIDLLLDHITVHHTNCARPCLSYGRRMLIGIFYSVSVGDQDIIAEITRSLELLRNSDLDSGSGLYETALYEAAKNGAEILVTALLDLDNLPIDLKAEMLQKSLDATLTYNEDETSQILLNHPRLGEYANLGTQLLNAAEERRFRQVQMLLAYSRAKRVLWLDFIGLALQSAARKGYFEIIKMILSHCRITRVRLSGSIDLALESAAQEGHVKVIEIILHHCRITNTSLRSSIYIALGKADSQGHEEAVAMLSEWSLADHHVASTKDPTLQNENEDQDQDGGFWLPSEEESFSDDE